MLKIFIYMGFGLLVSRSWWCSSFLLVGLMLGFMGTIPLIEVVSVLGFNIYLDSLSYSLCFLTLWLGVLMLVSSNMFLKGGSSNFFFVFLNLSLTTVLLISFLVSNYLMFYFFFEVSLIPTLLIITGWGFQPERLQAGVYFMLYTLTASLPLLLSLFYYYSSLGGLNMVSGLSLFSVNSGLGTIVLALGLIMAFLVKMPMFLVHLWLPKAHVEAPVAGSMILAGVLLKLGGYGISRVVSKFYLGISFFAPYLIGLSLFGMLFVGLICCRMNDMKALVAYSSVAHMGLVLGGIFSGYLWGLTGGLMMMISHGLSSSGLFCIVNMFYERSGSRSLYMNKGLLLILPAFTLLMFMLCAANISAPPTVNLMSEILLMLSVMSFDFMMVLVFPLGSFLGAVFTFYFFSYSQHGKPGGGGTNIIPSRFSDLHVLFLHIFPLNFLVLKPEVVFFWL